MRGHGFGANPRDCFKIGLDELKNMIINLGFYITDTLKIKERVRGKKTGRFFIIISHKN